MGSAEISSSRRTFLLSSAAVLGIAGAGLLSRFAGATEGQTIVTKPGKIMLERFSDLGKSLGKEEVMKVVRSEEEWRKQLSEIAFVVARQEGTERAYTGPFWDNHTAGLYRCIGCDNALFISDAKYDSGTGWPSFWQPIARENVIDIEDNGFGMTRTAVSCALCDAHLGHVFNDGPQPTGLRYCINGVTLRFIERPAA